MLSWLFYNLILKSASQTSFDVINPVVNYPQILVEHFFTWNHSGTVMK